ncbi:Holliday junction branch migration protein RuvA [Geitlerinema sp. PCC 9228]|uniref:Holliday junction branch migration protein RuvA n=1 Tax=Geitlerinema sp. PCC 9228 TaxID=111611 RepID=UPI0008F9CD2E|nr:Holliday junction branch migration protein RuvA [Geitlerinema sp. PCC 9228]
MIGSVRGYVTHISKSQQRVMVLLDVGGVGYEVQVPSHLVEELPSENTEVQVFTHLQVSDDRLILYGFGSLSERELFRQLVKVNGIGAQLAIALLDTLGFSQLLQAIVTENTRLLVQTPGVGKKTAERIALELKSKLAQWREESGVSISPTAGLSAQLQEEVEMTLLALGYTANEVMDAFQNLSQNKEVADSSDVEDWIRAAIAYLS